MQAPEKCCVFAGDTREVEMQSPVAGKKASPCEQERKPLGYSARLAEMAMAWSNVVVVVG